MATNFEGHTHQQLLTMIASADASTLTARGSELVKAAAAIKEIGESLKDHRVTGWEGESAQTFQNWVNEAGNATLRLSEYAKTGGEQMAHAGQVVVEVKANMPAYDTAAAENLAAARKYHNDPDSQQIGQQANSKLNGDHAQAVQQMTKLAQGYEASATGMEMAEVPTFPPPPARFVPIGVSSDGDMARSRGGSIGATREGGSSYAPSAGGVSGSSYTPGSGPEPGGTVTGSSGPTSPPVSVLPDRNVGVGLDNVSTLPDRTLPPAPGMPGGAGPSGAGGSGPGAVPGGFVPPSTLPAMGGALKPGGGNGPVGFVPGGAVRGTGGPGGIGGKVGGAGGIAGLPPRDSGIVGGRPVTSGGPGSSIPRGMVIGGEGAQATGRGMGMGGGMGGGGGHGAVGGSAAGRRLATEPGGVVGGRQPGSGGRSIAGGQPFTQGGSGLVRGGSGTGATSGPIGHGGMGSHGPGRRGDGQRGERPDYLAEDEETWQGDRSVVPPVID